MGLDSSLDATIASQGTAYYQVSSQLGGRLTVHLAASGFSARVSLVDGQGRSLVQSDGSASGGAGIIDVHVPKGASYLEVESLGAGGSYRIVADLIPASPAFGPVSSLFSGGGSALIVDDVDGDGFPDLIAPDGIHPGVGDGTFGDPVGGEMLTSDPDHNVTAMLSADFDHDGHKDLAVLESNSDGTASDVRILRNMGQGQFLLINTIDVSPDSGSIQVIEFGNGIMDLAVADPIAGQIEILVGDGMGGFSHGPVLDAGVVPVAMVAGRFGDGHVDLIVADRGDAATAPDAIGVVTVFRFDAPDQVGFATTLNVGSGPAAITAADLDGNGSLDLAVANSNSGDVSILLNNGDGTFRAQKKYLVGNLSSSIVAFSSRGNGLLDLAVSNSTSADVSILLNNGDGTFQPQLRFGAGANPVSLVSADLNHDGVPDLAVTDTGSGDGEIVTLLGRGDGTFQDAVSNPVGNGPLAGVSVDLNHDGYTDLLMVNSFANDVSVLLGFGDGSFAPATFFPVGGTPTAVAVGDFNGDNRIDAAFAIGSMGVAILLGNGDGTFQAATFLDTGTSTSSNAVSLVARDFTGDGVLDLAVANGGSNDVSILKGDGKGGFVPLAPVELGSAGSDPVSLVAGDFTGDGVLDLALVSRGSRSVSILKGDGAGGFEALASIPLGGASRDRAKAAAVGDFTGDGVLDLAVLISGSTDSVKIFPGLGGGQFDSAIPITLGRSLFSTSIVALQFFEGGPLDLAIADSNRGAVSLIQSDGNGGFQLLPMLKLGEGGPPEAVVSGDFNNDGKTDLAIGQAAPNGVSILLNQGNGNFADPGSVGLSPRNTPLVADLDADGVSDLIIVDGAGDILFRRGQRGHPGSYDPPITINSGLPARDIAAVATDQGIILASVNAQTAMVSLFAYRGGQFVLMRSLPTGQGPAQVVAADLLGTGVASNLIIRNAGDGTVTVYLGDLLGSTPTRIDLQAGAGISGLSVADINGDGLADLLLANQVTGQAEVMLNQGGGSFAAPILYRAGTGLSAVTVGADGTSLSVVSREETSGVVAVSLRRGGPLSLVTVNPGSATLGILNGLGGGRLGNPIALQTAGQASVVRAGDFNGDGNSDLATLGADGLTIRLGDGRGSLFPSATYDVGADPTGLTVADVNGDGKLDLIIGNTAGDVLILDGDGTGAFRTPLAADRTVSLVTADLQGKGIPTFVLANQTLDRVVVRKSGSTDQATVLGDHTTGLVLPGAPVLADLNGDGFLDLIVANTGGNSVLVYPGLSDGTFGPAANGGKGFSTGTNPSAITLGDVNGDGRLDVITANKGSNDVSVLLNQSQGSTFSLEGDLRLKTGSGPTALAYSDVNGDGTPDLLVSDSTSNDVRILSGIPGGFFNDTSPKIVPLALAPGGIFVGDFVGGPGPEIVALNPGTSSVTMISGLVTGTPTTRLFNSGGLDPVAAIARKGSDGFDDLVVANHDDGHVALLTGGDFGLTVDEVRSSSNAPNPTSLAFSPTQGGGLEVYVATEGEEFATLLLLSLAEVVSGNGTVTSLGSQGLTLVPSQDFSVPLIATLLTTFVTLDSTEGDPGSGEEQGAAAPASTGNSAGQSLATTPGDDELGDDDEGVEPPVAVIPPPDEASSVLPSWLRNVLGLDDAFDGFQLENRPAPTPDAGAEQAPSPVRGFPMNEPAKPAGLGRDTDPAELIDAALRDLSGDHHVQPGVPGRIDFDDPAQPRSTEPSLQPDPMTPAAQAILLGGIFLVANRPARRFLRQGALQRKAALWSAGFRERGRGMEPPVW